MHDERPTAEGYRDSKIPGSGDWGGVTNEERIYGCITHQFEGWGDISNNGPAVFITVVVAKFNAIVDFIDTTIYNIRKKDVRPFGDKRPIA